jgi:hypothetical protein
MKALARLAAMVSSLFCLVGGLWILSQVGFRTKDDAVWTGIGLYFVGKAFVLTAIPWVPRALTGA